MDRIMSDEERIRRAEEVVLRRENAKLELGYNKIKVDKSKTKTKTILIQILICLLIYGVFYYIKNTPVSDENTNRFIDKTKEILSYDIDFKQLYNNIFYKDDTDRNTEKNNETIIENNEDKNENNNDNISEENLDPNLGIGGELTEETNEGEAGNNNIENQIDEDVRYIKEKIPLIKPVQGVITSRFGERESSEIVSANHKGIDIGAATGTAINSACDGKVIEVSSSGDFGKHIKIQKDDVIFIYAHCSKLLVNEGDEIKQGQKIAEVGATGRATGPHLHFEIRRGERVVNPELVLKFE